MEYKVINKYDYFDVKINLENFCKNIKLNAN